MLTERYVQREAKRAELCESTAFEPFSCECVSAGVLLTGLIDVLIRDDSAQRDTKRAEMSQVSRRLARTGPRNHGPRGYR